LVGPTLIKTNAPGGEFKLKKNDLGTEAQGGRNKGIRGKPQGFQGEGGPRLRKMGRGGIKSGGEFRGLKSHYCKNAYCKKKGV